MAAPRRADRFIKRIHGGNKGSLRLDPGFLHVKVCLLSLDACSLACAGRTRRAPGYYPGAI